MELGPILRAMSRNKLRFTLIAAQIAVTLAIVANCVGLIQDARQKMSYPKAFDEENLILIKIPCADSSLKNDRRRQIAWGDEYRDRLRAISGVRAVTSSGYLLFIAANRGIVKAAGSNAAMTTTRVNAADADYVDAVGAELDEGRWYSQEELRRWDEWSIVHGAEERKRDANGKVLEPLVVDAVVSRSLGKHLFGDGPLVGKMMEDQDGDLLRIVGVLRHSYFPVRGGTIHPEHAVFYPGHSYTVMHGGRFIVRAEPGKASLVARRIEEELSKTVEFYQKSIWLFSEAKDLMYGAEQTTVTLMGMLIVLLLVVACLGTGGLTSSAVTERTRQIGTRRALGATTSDILRYFLTESAIVTTFGLLLGTGLAVLTHRALLPIYEGAKLDPTILVGSALLLFLAALGAALPPALRASRISPAIATKNI